VRSTLWLAHVLVLRGSLCASLALAGRLLALIALRLLERGLEDERGKVRVVGNGEGAGECREQGSPTRRTSGSTCTRPPFEGARAHPPLLVNRDAFVNTAHLHAHVPQS